MMDDQLIYGSSLKSSSNSSSSEGNSSPGTSFFSRLRPSSQKIESTSSESSKKGFWKSSNKVPGTIKPVEQPLFDANLSTIVSTMNTSKLLHLDNSNSAPPSPTTSSSNLSKSIDTTPSHNNTTNISRSATLPGVTKASSTENQIKNIMSKSVDFSSKNPSSPPLSPEQSKSAPSIHTPDSTASPNYSRNSVRTIPSDALESNLTYRAIDQNLNANKLVKFSKILSENIVDLDSLRKLCWQGIPADVRALCWKLLLEYLPANKDRREATIERKRKEYFDFIPRYFDVEENSRTTDEKELLKQIQRDVPRTNPNIQLFQSKVFQQSLARVLYIWSIRHPASSYVQGINDLATPFFVVFLSEVLEKDEVLHYDITNLNESNLANVEADTYWCMTKLLDGIQDHYTFAQLGIQRMVHKLSEIINRVDAPLYEHLKKHDVDYHQFSFRSIHCLLLRELPLPLVIRLWDTYFAEKEGFAVFHVYVAASFFQRFSNDLRLLDFQDIMLFVRNPPTHNWKTQDIELLVSQAYMWKTLYENSKHLE